MVLGLQLILIVYPLFSFLKARLAVNLTVKVVPNNSFLNLSVKSEIKP